MIKLNISTPATLTAGQKIPLNTVFSSTDYSNNGTDISIKSLGLHDIKAMINVTATATSALTIALYADDQVLAEASATDNLTEDLNYTFNITDVLRVVTAYAGSFANLYFTVSAPVQITSGNITIEKLR